LETEYVQFLLYFVYIRWRSNYQEGVGIPSTLLCPSHIIAMVV